MDRERARTIDEILDLRREIGRWMHRGLPREWLDVEITMSQLKTLLVLYGMERAAMGELAEALGIGVSTVTGIVDRLVEHGLVVREEDARDRRIVYGRPTQEGVALIERLMMATREQIAGVLATLSDEDLATVRAADQVLFAAMSRWHAVSAAARTTCRAQLFNPEGSQPPLPGGEG